MATRKPQQGKPRKRKSTTAVIPVEDLASEVDRINTEELAAYAERAMIRFGRETLDERAIPCLFDGLLTSRLRTLYAARTVCNSKKFVKAARLVGDTIGRFHPHGDVSAYKVLVTSVQAEVPLFQGSGNWGAHCEGAAAMRYTEIRTSEYGKLMMLPDYMAVVPMRPNYDDSDEEPIFMPSLLPNALMMTAFGIATGANSVMPAFAPPDLLAVTVRLLDGEDLTGPDMVRAMQPIHQWGGVCQRSRPNWTALSGLMVDSSSATIRFDPILDVDDQNKTITMKGIAPNVNVDTFVEKCRALSTVRECSDEGQGAEYVVRCAKTVNQTAFEATVEKVRALGTGRISYGMYCTARIPRGGGEYDVKFYSVPVKEILLMWIKWRVWLETKALAHRIALQEKERHRLEVLILASDNAQALVKLVQSSNDLENDVARFLKVTVEDARIVLALTIRRLSKMDRAVFEDGLRRVRAKIAQLKALARDPRGTVRASLVAAQDCFETGDFKIVNCQQWRLKTAAPILSALGYDPAPATENQDSDGSEEPDEA